MKCRLILKTPDALDTAIRNMAQEEIDTIVANNNNYDDEELDEIFEKIVRESTRKAEKWFRYCETLTLEIDFAKETCKVIEN